MDIGKLFKRIAIIGLWIVLIFVALYLPNMKIFPTQEKSINIFVWGDTILPEVLVAFEKETGIKVNLSYYATNEELQVKMKATGGEGYDLVMPSGYTVQILIEDGLLKPLARSKMNFMGDLNPALLDHPYDPNNVYSVPFEWEVYGLGYDKTYFAEKPFLKSWRMIYDSSFVDYKIALNNDPIENVAFSSLYLFGQADSITPEQFQEIRELLLKQRTWVEAYSDFRADYFIATGNCPIALCSSPLIKRIHPLFPNIEFALPEEGSLVTVENFCIPKASKKEKYTYQLLNYLFRESSVIAHCKNFGYFPARLIPTDELEMTSWEGTFYAYTKEDFQKLHFVKKLVPPKEIRKLWVEVKSF